MKQTVLRLGRQTFTASRPTTSSRLPVQNAISRTSRSISHTPRLLDESAEDDKYHQASTAAEPGAGGIHEGSFSRTDNQISFEYDETNPDLVPRSQVVQGRGGMHMKRTLPSFSLEGKVAVITGGARGLGLVMGQALIHSGADLAIVDLNSQ